MATKTLKNSGSARDDFRMRYQVFIEDIRYLKTRQWTVTYYLLLLFAAIITFWKSVEHAHQTNLLKDTLILISEFVYLVGVYFLHDFHKRNTYYRKEMIEKVLPNMSEPFQVYQRENLEKNYEGFWKDFPFTLAFLFILSLGPFAVYAFLKGGNFSNFFQWGLGGVAFFFLLKLLEFLIDQARKNVGQKGAK